MDGIGQVLALQLVVLGHLADEQRRVHSVLIAHVVARKVAVALLKAKDEALDAPLVGEAGDDIADVLKAGEAATQLKAVLGSQRVHHGGGYDGGHGNLVGEVLATLGAHLADVVEEHDTHLVAGDELVVIARLAGNANAVGIGVGREQQVGMHLLAHVDALLHGLANLGVGVRAGGEVPVGVGLFGHHGDIGHAGALEHGRHRDEAGTVERRVHQLERSLGHLLVREVGDGLGEHRVVVGHEHGVVDPVDDAVLGGLLKVGGLHAVEGVGLGDGGGDGRSSLARDLATVGTIGLVAVVGSRVVGGRHADTARAVQVAGGPRERGNRRDLGVDVGLHAVGSQNGGRHAHEEVALVAAIARDGNARVLEVFHQVVRKALRGATDGVDVHAVGARAQRAAQAGGAELKVLEEGIGDGVLVTGILHGLELGGQLRIRDILDPRIEKLVHILHGCTLPLFDRQSHGACAPSICMICHI